MAKEQYYIDMMGKPWQDFVKPVKLPVLAKRIRITAECRDCDHLPRVANAGECFVDKNGYAVQVMHNGLKVLYGRYYGAWVNEIIRRLQGVHEPQEEKVFDAVVRQLPPGSVMIEAGCYWGYYSMWFARTVRNARTYLVEPNPNQMRVAQDNFALNGLTGDFTCGYFGSYPEKKKRIQEQRVGQLPGFSIKEFMLYKDLSHITLFHADIQGHEEEMLDKARALLRWRRIDYLFVSTHGRRHPACRDILADAGYQILAEHEIDESASADGLIVAQNPEMRPISVQVSKVKGLIQSHRRERTRTGD